MTALLREGDNVLGAKLADGFLPDQDQRAHAGNRLVDVVRKQGHHIGTGFLGTPLIRDALTSAGALKGAYKLLPRPAAPPCCIRSQWGPPRSGNAGTACCPTGP